MVKWPVHLSRDAYQVKQTFKHNHQMIHATHSVRPIDLFFDYQSDSVHFQSNFYKRLEDRDSIMVHLDWNFVDFNNCCNVHKLLILSFKIVYFSIPSS